MIWKISPYESCSEFSSLAFSKIIVFRLIRELTVNMYFQYPIVFLKIDLANLLNSVFQV